MLKTRYKICVLPLRCEQVPVRDFLFPAVFRGYESDKPGLFMYPRQRTATLSKTDTFAEKHPEKNQLRLHIEFVYKTHTQPCTPVDSCIQSIIQRVFREGTKSFLLQNSPNSVQKTRKDAHSLNINIHTSDWKLPLFSSRQWIKRIIISPKMACFFRIRIDGKKKLVPGPHTKPSQP